jgi:uncharacterized protein (TIRG00374 family)
VGSAEEQPAEVAGTTPAHHDAGSAPAPAGAAPGEALARSRFSVGRVLLLSVTGISLYFLAPSIVEVLEAWRKLDRFDAGWLVVILGCEAASFASIWALQRVVLPEVSWFDGATSQLVGNAFNRITPGGGATGTALQAKLLSDAGYDLTRVATALTANSVMISVTVLILPVFSLPAIIAGLDVPGSLADAAWIGILVFAFVAAGGAAVLHSPAPIAAVGDGIEWVVNHLRRRRPPIQGLGERLVQQRAVLRGSVGSHWVLAVTAAVGRWAFEYLALLVALHAIGANVEPTLVLLAFTFAELLGLLPFTPGGLGFVEAGMTATLALAGVSASDAVLATLIFRLVSFWLPLPVGLAAMFLYRRRHPRGEPSARPDAGAEAPPRHTHDRDP